MTTAAAADSNFIAPAERELEARFAGRFALPFSSNNMAIRDLAVDAVFLKANATHVEEEGRMAPLRKAFETAVQELISGQRQMVTDSADLIASAGEPVWSTNEDYTPVFGMGDAAHEEVDPDRIDDEQDARS